ncbi:glycerol-3-phosphate dehydrogenase/oxidase [Rhodobacter sp. KR11]|uniref:glycerol-3-phosphate dehydrogenase/oxidase n=1 Tax=Rhodobacter sp. KR11 TaxID=2974588 RepID=UPI002223DB25|nr:glycerol-3-phosphate dehydrogenase/oxidase [Rhodobacter sp. KR11]MCW1919849.1 glycerol-3-phosphate dehydrogenase/oxidase [Rhodobacter sp. KR11]
MSEPFDVVIIGAGVNGAGLFRDLCEQGVKCLILDKGDWGSGTSAAPSRLIHGGIKYLETGEFRLVAQSTLERNLLLKNAPHAVLPLPTVIPIFSWFKGIGAALRTLAGSTTAPRERGAVLMKIGLALYDLYGARERVMPRHQMWSRARSLRELPLTPRIKAAGLYYDARIAMPERLVWELISDGLRANPTSRAVSHATFTHQGATLTVTNEDATLTAAPLLVVNAAGPWIDRVNASLGIEGRLIGGTKGAHILLDAPDLVAALKGRMVYFEADDGRICLVYEHLGRAMVGSTDLRADDPDTLVVSDEEQAYLIGAVRALFPGVALGPVVHAYSGLRPLPYTAGKAAGLISRDHSAPWTEPAPGRPWPVISLVGGKWTTFRGFAEEVADVLLSRLGLTRLVSTRGLPIGGGRDFPRDISALPTEVQALVQRYGSTGLQVPTGGIPLTDAPDFTESELAWIVRNERVLRLEDLVLRRTPLAITGRLTLPMLDHLAQIAGAVRGWSPERQAAEVAAVKDTLTRRHRWRF